MPASTQPLYHIRLGIAQAHWVARDCILWNTAAPREAAFSLFWSPRGGLAARASGLQGGEHVPLELDPHGPDMALLEKFPHLGGFQAYRLPPEALPRLPEILKSQSVVAALDQHGRLLDATALQLPGVLDDLYTYAGPLGVTWEAGRPVLRLWAPTAWSVTLHLYHGPRDEEAEAVPMTWDPQTGVWTAAGVPTWKGCFYLYEVEVFVRSTGRVERNWVTDPYSISLSTNSRRSQIIDLRDPAWQPPGWEGLRKPPLEAPEDIVLYELHVRDFSASDPSVPTQHQGGYLAFTHPESHGMRHLKSLAEAGLTHIHLLPVFDFASVNEDRAAWKNVDRERLRGLPGDSNEQQAAAIRVKDRDPFNWGYDPYHFTTPEGSYSANPDGGARILEFREMVAALNRAGLRVVMDVVYNHTFAGGQDARSVLDRVVPGYYHRLNNIGEIASSTCCANTASEHAMMEKLMIDSLVTWAREYKIDGFRFDLMGHHMVSNLRRVRAALDALTLGQDGVDGSQIYLYGEGWDFGEVAHGARGANASQFNLGGTGVGVFNDRLRNGVRGGAPFSGLLEQGFVTGLYWEPNQAEGRSPDAQRAHLLYTSDWIRASLAGNLREFEFENAEGQRVSGDRVDYHGGATAYGLDPQENVLYISAHDNETLFDAIQLKTAAYVSIDDRVRMHNLGISLVMLGQGVPFFLAGDDLLRSKSLDRNSYNSGDWFNTLDFTYQSNNWAVGLPPDENRPNWPVMVPLLSDPALKPGPEHIQQAMYHFRAMLMIRKSSPLFRLRTARAVQARLHFLNTGPNQIPGLIAMHLADRPDEPLDPRWNHITVLFNATPRWQTFQHPSQRGYPFELHPILAQSYDRYTRQSRYSAREGVYMVAPRSVAVFVAPRYQ